jgi:hypothetical protein
MICEWCDQEFCRVRGSLKDQITRRGAGWIMARCVTCGREMLFHETGSAENKRKQRARLDTIRRLYRAARHAGKDLDADQEALEDEEIAERRARGEDV